MAIKRWNANTSTWDLVGTPGTVTPAAIGAASLSGNNTYTGKQTFQDYVVMRNNNTSIYDIDSGSDISSFWPFQISGPNGTARSILGSVDSQTSISGFAGINSSSKPIVSSYLLGKLDNTTAGSETGSLTFFTKPSNGPAYANPRMLINSSGNIGINNSSPGAKLDIKQDAENGLRITGVNGGTYDFYRDTPTGYLRISGSQNDYSGYFFATTVGGVTSDKMILNASGNIGIGTTSPGYKVDIQDSSTGNWYGLRLLSSAPVTQGYSGISLEKGPGYGGIVAGYLHQSVGSGLQILTNNGGTVVEVARAISNGSSFLIGYTTTNSTSYRLQVNSQIFATSSSIATSDGRYKENILPITSGLDIIDSLNPVSFNWKEHPVHNFVPGKTVGFIAQEVKEALKDYEWVDNIIKTNNMEAVLDEEGNEITPAEEFLGIAESNIIPLLVSAVKELRAEVNTLKAQVNN